MSREHPSEEPSDGCFIATAAYGTSMTNELDVLRTFRDDLLIPSAVGYKMVLLYYRVSPPIADIVSKSNTLRIITRCILRPIIIILRHIM